MENAKTHWISGYQKTTKKPASGQEKQKTEGWHLLVWRRSALWFKRVFLRRKEYVPGDTCRFIWQKVPEVQSSFVYYRVLHMLGNLLCLAISFFHFFRIDPPSTILCEKQETLVVCFGSARVQYEWFFYVTSLGLMLNALQSVWGFVLTLMAYLRQRKTAEDVDSKEDFQEPSSIEIKVNPKGWFPTFVGFKESVPKNDLSPERLGLGKKVEHTKDVANPESGNVQSTMKEHAIFTRTGFYWGMHSFCICLSAIIDIVFWTMLYAYDPVLPSTYIINQLAEHGFNLPLMIADYCVVAFPILPLHALFPAVFSVIYLIVNYFYFLAGGKNETQRNRYLYPFLNWENPAKAVAYGVGVAAGLTISMMMLLVVDHFKFKIRPQAIFNATQATKIRSSATSPQDSV